MFKRSLWGAVHCVASLESHSASYLICYASKCWDRFASCLTPFPMCCMCSCTPMDIFWKSVLHRHQFEKCCAPCKGEEREPVKCLAGIQTHMSSAFFFLSPALLILSREKMSWVWFELLSQIHVGSKWIHFDFFLNSFLAQNQHRTLSLINETHPVPCLIFKVC